MQLSTRQKKHLRSLGHALRPVVTLGAAGASPAVIAELDIALADHELVKVKVRSGERSARNESVSVLCERTGATLIQQIGHMALLYRPDPDTPTIQLPPA
jgi:RNA-binding protein